MNRSSPDTITTKTATRGSSWPDLLDGSGLDWAIRIVTQLNGVDAARVLQDHDRMGAHSSTRQARHKSRRRLRSTVIAGAILHAANDDAAVEFVLSPGFGRIRPICAETHHKLKFLLRNDTPVSFDGAVRLFCRCSDYLVTFWVERHQRSADQLLSVNGALAGMFLGPMVFGDRFVPFWKDLRQVAEAHGLLASPYLRMQLALLGAYAGEPAYHVDWLMTPDNRLLELADSLLFVRQDALTETIALQQAHIEGKAPIGLRGYMYSPRPLSTIALLIEYICGCMRSTNNLSLPSFALMMLNWLAEMPHLVEVARSSSTTVGEFERIQSLLAKVEKIQIMEKARFWEMVETVQDQRLRSRLLELWTQRP